MDNLAEELRRLSEDKKLLWEVARKAIEAELVWMRDGGFSLLGRNNGLVINFRDGTPNEIIRMGPEDAMRVGLRAIANYLEEQETANE